eukprot:12664318-Alexandrium_andersonii.AAC.1
MEFQCSALPAIGPGALSLLGEAMEATALSAAKLPRTWLKSGQSWGRGWSAFGKSFWRAGKTALSL